MITNFYGGVKEKTKESISVALGCGCFCNCPDTEDRINGPQTSNADLMCQPLPKFVAPIPFPF